MRVTHIYIHVLSLSEKRHSFSLTTHVSQELGQCDLNENRVSSSVKIDDTVMRAKYNKQDLRDGNRQALVRSSRECCYFISYVRTQQKTNMGADCFHFWPSLGKLTN